MARIRTIKPEFWTDEKIVELPMTARLLFIGLWNLCDDHGRMEYSPKRIKLQLFPSDKIDVAQICGDLRRNGQIILYSVEGKEYLQVTNFKKHQQIKDGSRSSKFPEPPAEIFCANLHESPQIAQNSQEGKGKEGKGKDQGKEGTAQSALEILFEEFWKVYPKKKSKGDALKAFATIEPKPDEQLVATMIATIERAKTSEQWRSSGGQYIPYPATWLRDKGWLDEFECEVVQEEKPKVLWKTDLNGQPIYDVRGNLIPLQAGES